VADRQRRLDFLDFGRRGALAPEPSGRAGVAPRPEPSTENRPAPATALTASPPSPWIGHEAVLPEFVRWLDGEETVGPAGPALVVRRSYPATVRLGRQPLARALDVDGARLRQIGRDDTLAQLDISRLAFIDCETTGLSGGTGTLAFLVGIAWLDGSTVVTEQYFLPDFPAERAFVAAIGQSLDGFDGLVSFNGRSFDVPLLETRFALTKLPSECLELPHLDLLHPSRRIWKHRLETCALGSIEQHVLGHFRDDDVPGWIIPQLFFDYLRSGDVRTLAQVFEHNRLDLLAMVALVGRLGQMLDEEVVPDDGPDLYGLGTLLDDLGEAERALRAYETALTLGLPPDLRSRALIRMAVALRRSGRRDLAAQAWERLARERGDSAARALVELAKHYEHEEHDYETAADLTRQAGLLVGLRPWVTGPDTAQDQLARRLARLERKARRAGQRPMTFTGGSEVSLVEPLAAGP